MMGEHIKFFRKTIATDQRERRAEDATTGVRNNGRQSVSSDRRHCTGQHGNNR